MEIITKFNHGQRVQAISYGEEEYVEKCPVCEGKGFFIYKDRKIGCSESGCWGKGYVAKYRNKKWFVPTDPYYNFVVQKIGVELYNPNNKTVSSNRSWIYYMAANSGTMFDEKNVFSSSKEAQEECDKRNKEI